MNVKGAGHRVLRMYIPESAGSGEGGDGGGEFLCFMLGTGDRGLDESAI